MATLVRRDAEQEQTREPEVPVPTPRWWPGGLPMHVSDTDSHGTSIVVSLEAPGRPVLARWPVDSEPLASWRHDGDQRHAHEYNWTDVRWHWALRCDIELDDADLALIADSMIDVAEYHA